MKNSILKSLERGLKTVGRTLDKHSPEILIGCGIVGFISTAVLVAKEAPVVKEKLDDLHKEMAKSDEELTKPQIIFEEVKTALPVYTPAVVTGAVSTACILGSYKISSGRTAALATAYELSQAGFAEYKAKVTEKIGEKKEKEVEQAIIEDHARQNPPSEAMTSQVVMTDGMSLFYDEGGGRWFRSSIDHIRSAEKRIAERLANEMWISLNELYYELGMANTKNGDDLGFYVGYGIDISMVPIMAPDGTPCMAMTYSTISKEEYRAKFE